MAAYLLPFFLLTALPAFSFGKSPELNTVCYGRSSYHKNSLSTVVYDGELNTTLSGASCLQWKTDPFTSNKPDHSHVLDENHNFCRGVETRSGRPWCYIDLESSELSVRHPAVRRGWDWCNIGHCHFYRTECQRLRDLFDSAESEFNRRVDFGLEPVPNDYCRPACDDNGDYEMVQHCNRQFVKSDEATS